MQKVIGVTELQRRFRSIFDEVTQESTPYVLTRGSRPEAALIPYDTFLHLMELQEDELLAEFDRLSARIAEQTASFTEEEVTPKKVNSRISHKLHLWCGPLQSSQIIQFSDFDFRISTSGD
jgi:prevent-host-death family protein